jgi:hypothetical protein
VLHHQNLLQLESESFDRFSTSAVCHFILHPIALGYLPPRLAIATVISHEAARREENRDIP